MKKQTDIVPADYRFQTALGCFRWEPEKELVEELVGEMAAKAAQLLSSKKGDEGATQPIEKEVQAMFRLFFRVQLAQCLQDAVFQAADEALAKAVNFSPETDKQTRQALFTAALAEASRRSERRLSGLQGKPGKENKRGRKRGRPATVEARITREIEPFFQRAELIEVIRQRLDAGLPVSISDLAQKIGMGRAGANSRDDTGARMMRKMLNRIGENKDKPQTILDQLIAEACGQLALN